MSCVLKFLLTDIYIRSIMESCGSSQ